MARVDIFKQTNTFYDNRPFHNYIQAGISYSALHYNPLELNEYWKDPLQVLRYKTLNSSTRKNTTENFEPHIFFIGDSVNRLLVQDSCHKWQGQLEEWGTFRYKHGAMASCHCKYQGGQFGYLNVYGSSQEGPYAFDHKNSVEDPYTDTRLRVSQGIQIYTKLYGTPHLVFYRSDIWDLQVHSPLPPVQHKRYALFDKIQQNKYCDADIVDDPLRAKAPTTQAERNKIVDDYIHSINISNVTVYSEEATHYNCSDSYNSYHSLGSGIIP